MTRRRGGAQGSGSALRRSWDRLSSRRRLGPVLRFLRRHWLMVIAGLSLAALIVAIHPRKLWGVLEHVHLVPLALMLPCTVAIYVVRALGWHVALRRSGVRISVRRTITVMIAGQTMIFLPAGDLARVGMVMETGASGHDAGEITGTIAFQELLYMTLMGFAVLPAIAQHPDIGGIVALITVIQVSIFAVLLWPRGYDMAVRVVEKVRFLRRFDKDIRHIRTAFVHLLEPRTGLPIIGWNVLALGFAFLLFELALHSVGVTNVGYAKAAFIYALGHILAAVSMLPGGVGVYEGVLTAFMALQGVPPSEGAAAALLYRGFNDLVMALLGVGAGWWLRMRWPRGERGDNPAGRRGKRKEARGKAAAGRSR